MNSSSRSISGAVRVSVGSPFMFLFGIWSKSFVYAESSILSKDWASTGSFLSPLSCLILVRLDPPPLLVFYFIFVLQCLWFPFCSVWTCWIAIWFTFMISELVSNCVEFHMNVQCIPLIFLLEFWLTFLIHLSIKIYLCLFYMVWVGCGFHL